MHIKTVRKVTESRMMAACRRPFVQARKPSFRIQVVGIDERREHHADQERGAESNRFGIARSDRWRLGIGQADFTLPNGGQVVEMIR